MPDARRSSGRVGRSGNSSSNGSLGFRFGSGVSPRFQAKFTKPPVAPAHPAEQSPASLAKSESAKPIEGLSPPTQRLSPLPQPPPASAKFGEAPKPVPVAKPITEPSPTARFSPGEGAKPPSVDGRVNPSPLAASLATEVAAQSMMGSGGMESGFGVPEFESPQIPVYDSIPNYSPARHME